MVRSTLEFARRILRNHPLLPLLGMILLSLIVGLLTQAYWNTHDAVVYIDQGETFLRDQQTGASLLYYDPQTFIHIGFHYLGPVCQAMSYRFFDDIFGPHLISLILLSLVTILVWHWAYLRSGRWQIAYLCAIAILFEPILRKSVHGNRIDIYAFFFGFFAFWLFEQVRQTSRSWLQNLSFFGIGFCYVIACFMWMTSLIWGPFGLAYAIDIAFEQRWKFTTYLRRLGWALFGVCVAAILITCPLWSRWTAVIHETVVGFSFAANPPWSTDGSNWTRYLLVAFRSPLLVLPLAAFVLRWFRRERDDESSPEGDSIPCDVVTLLNERPQRGWRRCQWLYAVAISLAICGIFRTFVYPFRVLYLLPMMLFLFHEWIATVCWKCGNDTVGSTSQSLEEITRLECVVVRSPPEQNEKTSDRKTPMCCEFAGFLKKKFDVRTSYPWRKILIYFFIGLFSFQTVDVFQHAHKLYRQREYRSHDWVVSAFRSAGVTRCSVAIHSWHLYLVGRKLGWQMYCSAYFNPADVLQIPEVEYAILELNNDQAKTFRQGLLTQHFEYVVTFHSPMIPNKTLFGRTLSSHYGPYELWRRCGAQVVPKSCTNRVASQSSPDHVPISADSR